MKRILTNGIYTIMAISGVLQFLWLPGMVWNMTFPFLQIMLILLALKVLKTNRYIRKCTLLILILFLADIGFLIYSNLNTSSSGAEQEITVMSYNLFFKNKSPNQSIAIIQDADPDIIFVQELTPSWAFDLDRKLGVKYTYKKIIPLKGTYGLGIYTKYKIDNQKIVYNKSKKPYAQIVDLEIDNKRIQLINTHLASPAIAVENKDQFLSLYSRNYQLRKKQIKELNNLADSGLKQYDCQLLVGDLNTLHSEPIFKKLKFRWVNSSNSLLRWMTFNFPNSSKIRPMVTLDYIMGRGKMKFLESKVIKGGSSDHLGLWAEMKI